MYITSKDIRTCVESVDFSKGLDYYHSQRVLGLDILNSDATNLKFFSAVKGSANNIYKQNIKIVYLDNKYILHGDCSCPVAYNCKHVVAACIAYVVSNIKKIQKEEERPSFLVDKWVERLHKNAADKSISTANEDGYFITYRLFDEKSRYKNDAFSIYKTKILKNNKLSQGAKLDEYKFFSSYGYSDIKNDEDRNIAVLMEGLYRNSKGGSIVFSSKIGYLSMKELIKTKRCYFNTNKDPLQYTDTLYELQFHWKKYNNTYKIESSLDKNMRILYTTPPLIIDSVHSLVYKTNLDADFLKEIENCPPITENEILKVYETFQRSAPEIKLATPKGIQTKKVHAKPVPRLKLFYEGDESKKYHGIKVSFEYGDYEIRYYPQNPTASFFQENIKTEIFRDASFEQNVKERLEQLGFESKKEENDLYFFSQNDTNRQVQLKTWSSFLEFHMPKLVSEGWHVEVDESFEMRFESNSNIVVQSEETNGWFSLAFNIEFNGVSQSLVPLVSNIIREFDDYENLPEYINIEVAKNSFVSLEKKQIQPILKTIFELLDKKDKENTLKISSFDAHLLDAMDENIIWRGSREILELSKKLKNFEGIQRVEPPKSLSTTLREYQQDGLNWLNFLYEFGFSGILADDMGLGKTIQTLSHLSRLKEDGKLTKPSLIVMPTSLIANWKNEVKKFTPNLRVLSLQGSDRHTRFEHINDYDLVLSTYPLITRDKELFDKESFCYIILDEAQKIKNPNTKMTMAIKTFRCEHKLALSGTPIENHLGELWSIFSFLMPGFLDNLSFFKNYYQTPIEIEHDFQKQELLSKRIKPFMIRRTKEKVAHELPAKSEIIKYTQFEAKQEKLYEAIRVTMEKKVREAVSQKGIGSSHITILDALLKLRQVCCDPSLLKIEEAQKVKESAKLELFLDLIEELLQEGRKILVFSQFTSMLGIIEQKIIEKEVSYTKLTGSTKNREEAIERFTSGKADIFLISLKAGGVGLNLVEADTVIHYDPWWNPAVENQATDRAYRIGQTKAVFVYKLIVENSIEQKILELQKKKQSLQDGIYDNNKQQEDMKFSGDELLDLLS